MADYTVVWSDKAYNSLRKVHEYITEDSVEGAKKVVLELVQFSRSLENLPRRNPIEPGLADAPVGYRFLVKWSFKIIYTILEEDKIVLVGWYLIPVKIRRN